MAKRKTRSGGRVSIKQNRPNWRKKVIGYHPREKFYRKPKKIKGKEWERVK